MLYELLLDDDEELLYELLLDDDELLCPPPPRDDDTELLCPPPCDPPPREPPLCPPPRCANAGVAQRTSPKAIAVINLLVFIVHPFFWVSMFFHDAKLLPAFQVKP